MFTHVLFRSGAAGWLPVPAGRPSVLPLAAVLIVIGRQRFTTANADYPLMSDQPVPLPLLNYARDAQVTEMDRRSNAIICGKKC